MVYQRVLITGANGLLGQELVRQLGSLPHYDVLATARDDAPLFSGGSCGYVPMDITDSTAVNTIFQDFAPDVVVNCAAMTNVDKCETQKEQCWQINADAVDHLAKLCLGSGSRIVQLSTDFVFDGLSGPYVESDRPNPLSFYGRSKLASENAARAAGIDRWAVVRTILVYGAGENLSRDNFVLWVVGKLSRGETINVVTDQWRSPTYAPDLAHGIERIIRFHKNGVFHLSGRELYTIHDLALSVADIFGLDRSLIRPTDASRFSQLAVRPRETGFIILKAETELGYKPRNLDQSLEDLARRLQLLSPDRN